MDAGPDVAARLRAAGCVFAEDEARVIADAARTHGELEAMVLRRSGGEPLEQVVGWAEFAGLRILVDPGVFVPRRRSEFLVSIAVRAGRRARWRLWCRYSDTKGANAAPPGGDAGGAEGAEGGWVVVDLCCGTGALGVAVTGRLARGGGSVKLHAADLDPAAVACARRNVEPAGGRAYQGDLFAPLPPQLRGRVGVLTCNAPYVPSAEVEFMPAEAREHEALLALDGGADGLAVLRRVAATAPAWLAPGGMLLVETSSRQAPDMASVMTAAGLTARVHHDEESGATVVTGTR